MVDTHARPKFKTPRSNPLQPKPSIPTPQTRILRTTPKTKMWLTGAGIVVDTHVHRVSRRLGWAPSGQGTSPETTRNALEEYSPHTQTYRGTSLVRDRHPVGPYSRTMPRVLGGVGSCAPRSPRYCSYSLAKSIPEH